MAPVFAWGFSTINTIGSALEKGKVQSNPCPA